MNKWIGVISVGAVLVAGFGCSGEIDELGDDAPIMLFDDDDELYVVNPQAVLGVDASRSGVIDFDDPVDREQRYEPDEGYGALFMANLDDDGGACVDLHADSDFEACYDARRDEVVDDQDLADMARIKTRPTGRVTESAYGVLDIDDDSRGRVRLYKNTAGGNGADAFVPYEPGEEEFDAEALESGVEFAIEGLSLVDDREEWDGVVELEWEINLPDSYRTIRDRAHIELAPVLIPHHLDPARVVYAADLGSENADFISDLNAGTEAAEVPDGLQLLDLWDPWVQDYLLTGYMAIPGPDGPRAIHVYFRSANLNYPGSLEDVFERIYQIENQQMPPQLREAGRVVFTDFHGSGTAGRAKYDPDAGFEPVDTTGLDIDDVVAYLYGESSDKEYPEIAELYDQVFDADTLNSFGNTEVVPPHVAPDGSEYPNGRVFRGRGEEEHMRPDPSLTNLFDEQGEQPVIWIDTAWKLVAHVDETLSFVETDTERGWSLLYNDPVRAREILERVRDEEGAGDAILFENRYYRSWGGGSSSAERTVNQVLNDEDVMAASARAAVEVDAQVDIMKDEVGLDDDDLIPIGYLHEDAGRGSVAYQPGIINGISFSPDAFGPPKPHGPRIDGVDVFEEDVENLLNPLGIDLHWIETWDVYHVGSGQVHCGSNVERQLPQTPWWAKESE